MNGSRTEHAMPSRYLFRVERAAVVAGAPPVGLGGDAEAGDMAVAVGLPDEAGEGLAVVSGREPGVVLVRQARHCLTNCTRSIDGAARATLTRW